MKIDQNLRAAIRSAEKMQAATDTWQIRQSNQIKSISAFLKKHPSKARRIRTLLTTIDRNAKVLSDAREELCKSFGLRETGDKAYTDGVTYSHCDSDQKAFKRAGGVPATVGEKWRFDAVMAELAATEPKQLTAILKKYGINWK